MCNATVNFDDKPLYPSTVNNKELHQVLWKSCKGYVVREKRFRDVTIDGGRRRSFLQRLSRDTSIGLECKMRLRASLNRSALQYFTVSEDVLPYGAAFHASVATRYLPEYQ
ncbi:hypothetical protein HYC85_027419 [Camellia sinensis]|uniref:Uncharacterized protein n=1 Tax=Camellia sinensis TaxID=4442 RepID=A0A7J7G6C5_CAMSI|nr:hypothetical protein HYC85_027419 [Camellia sinensis]